MQNLPTSADFNLSKVQLEGKFLNQLERPVANFNLSKVQLEV